jgi:hypothetical protein
VRVLGARGKGLGKLAVFDVIGDAENV